MAVENSENQQVKSRRDGFVSRMKERHPEREYADDEELFGGINDDYDDYEHQIGEYKKHEQGMSDLFTKDPRSAQFLMNWKNGEDPTIQMVKLFGSEFADAMNDPAKQEEIAAANKEYLDRVSAEKDLESQYQKNLSESLGAMQKLQDEKGISDEDIDAAAGLIQQITSDAIVGKISTESIMMALKALKHDEDVTQAGAEGEARGKNTKIDEKLRKSTTSQMPPNIGSKTAPVPPKMKRNLGALDRYGTNSTSIWDRGKTK